MPFNENSFNITKQDATEDRINVLDTQESPISTQESLFDPPVVDETVLEKSACDNSLGQNMKIILDEVKVLKRDP